MADSKLKKKADRKRISLKQTYEVHDWCRSLGCTPKQLRAAVKKVGPMAADVRRWLAAPKLATGLRQARAALPTCGSAYDQATAALACMKGATKD